MNDSYEVVAGDVSIRDGVIVAVGRAITESHDQTIDAREGYVVPGLVQTHVHLCQTLFRGYADDLELMDWLRTRVWPMEAAHTPSSLGAAAQLATSELLLSGTTSVMTMETVHDTDAVFEAAAESGIRATIGKCMLVESRSPSPSGEGERESFIPTRESLLSRIKDWEDRESWQEFFDTYWRLIYGVARKSGLNDAEAQDIVQETVFSVARKIEGFRYDPNVCSFKSWMLQLTRWRIINQLKKQQREDGREEHFSSQGDATATLEQIPDPAGLNLNVVWDEEWEKNLLAAALERVKRKVDSEQFQIFDLYCVEHWPARKVAHTLGVSIGRVYLARHRIGAQLKKEVRLIESRTL